MVILTRYKPFSYKQRLLLTWWCRDSEKYDAVIADGAVRSGKTLCMSISFVAWAMQAFNNASFAICGKTITSLKRNVVAPMLSALAELGFSCSYIASKNYIEISIGSIANSFYLFGGRDESSASLIQGITLSGIMLDEVALMPRSFVEQAIARCSVYGSKFWFNCNPEHPYHWFYLEWIKKLEEKNALYIHFRMEDNPSLTPKILKRYHSLYSGSFYNRFVLGEWCAVQGLIYPMFNPQVHIVSNDRLPLKCEDYYVSCDYGTVNPTSMGLWGKHDGTWYRICEYYFDSRVSLCSKTDEEYYLELERLCDNLEINAVVVDPSAASFIECINRHGKYKAVPAKNDVIGGIRAVSDLLRSGEILFSDICFDTIREFALYVWEDGSTDDRPRKRNDHAMDDIRYFVSTIASKDNRYDDFFVMSQLQK